MSIISGEISNVEMVGHSRGGGMDKAAADRIEDQLRSVFPEGAITRVQVLGYGDDLEVEPGQAAARVRHTVMGVVGAAAAANVNSSFPTPANTEGPAS